MRTLTAQQTQLLTQQRYGCAVRVLCDNGLGTLTDLTTLSGFNWVKSVKWSESVDDRAAKFTIVLQREVYKKSLAPLVTASQLNVATGAYLPQVQVGRHIQIQTALFPMETPPAALTWILSLDGYIDTIDPGKGDFEIEIAGRDLGGRILDRVAEASLPLNAGGSSLLETSMQNDVINGIFTPPLGTLDPIAPTLFVPTSPGWTLSQLGAIQIGTSCLDQLSQMAQQIGWDVRYLWDNGTSAFRLTLYQPQRTAPSVNETFTQAQYWSVSQVATDAAWVRNVVSVAYGNTTGGAGGGGAYVDPFSPLVVSNPASIAKYGRKFCQIGLAASNNIFDSTHANSLAQSVLSDLQDPIMVLSADLPFRPEVMLGDYDTFKAPTPWFDVDTSLGVIGIAHSFDNPGDKGDSAQCSTTLTLRGYPSGSINDWQQAIAGQGTAPKIVASIPSAQTVLSVGAQLRGGFLNTAIPNAQVTDWYESQLHVSTVNNFTPTTATLAQRGRISQFAVSNLVPGTTYYAKIITVDRQGNQVIGPQQTFVADSVGLGDFTAQVKQGFKAHLSTTQSLGAASPHTMLFDAVDYDGQANYTAAAGRFTAHFAGAYSFTSTVKVTGLSNGGTETAYLAFVTSGHGTLKGPAAPLIVDPDSAGSSVITPTFSTTLVLNAGETVTVQMVWQGAALNGTSAVATFSHFEGFALLG